MKNLVAATLIGILVLIPAAQAADGTSVWPDPASWKGVQVKWIRFRYDSQNLRGWALEYWTGITRPRLERSVLIFFNDDPLNPNAHDKPVLAIYWRGVFDSSGLRRYHRVETFVPKDGAWQHFATYLRPYPQPLVENKLLFLDPDSRAGQVFGAWAVAHGASESDVPALMPYWETRQDARGAWKIFFWYPKGVDVQAP